jgi:hypothetical protein
MLLRQLIADEGEKLKSNIRGIDGKTVYPSRRPRGRGGGQRLFTSLRAGLVRVESTCHSQGAIHLDPYIENSTFKSLSDI